MYVRRAWIVFLLLGVLVAPLYWSVPADQSKLLIWPIIGWSSVAAVCIGVRVNRPDAPGAWYLLALGAAVFITGDNLYSYRAQVLDEMTFPSIVDVIYLCMYPVMIAGLAILVRRRTNGRDWASVIDAAIVTAAAALLSWVFLIHPITESDMGVLERMTSIAYPVGDIAILALLMRLAVGGGRRPGAFWLLLLAGAPLLVADWAYGYLNLLGLWHEQHPVDAGWILFYVAWGAAALHPSMSELSKPAEVPPTRPIRLVLIGSAALIPPVVLIYEEMVGKSHDVVAIGGFTIAIFCLVLVRIVGFARHVAATQSEERFRGVLQHAADAIFVIGADGRVAYQTPSAERLFGRSLENLTAQRVSDLLAAEHGDELRRAMTTVDTTASYEWRVRNGADAWREVDVQVSDLRNEPTVRGVVFTLRDTTDRNRLTAEREQALAAAKEASRQKSVFLANMSHEIRTPLNGVMGMIGLLCDSPLDGEQREYAETMATSADCLLSIVNDVLDFSRIEAGRLEVDHHPFSLRPALEAALTLGVVNARAKGLELVCVVDPAVPDVVVGDRVRLRQVVGNLVSNATKFTHAGEVVVHAGLLGDDQLCVSVRDTGIGIDDRDKERMFEQYVQADDSTTRRYGGSGLGLAISKQLVELMGGRIGIDSEVGVGSTFWFTLPLLKHVTQATTVGPSGVDGRRVLVVSAQSSVRRSLVALLERWSISSVETADAAVAKRLLFSAASGPTPFDAVVVDERIIDAEAQSFVAELRNNAALASLVVIGLTRRPQAAADTEACQTDAVLVKPVRGSALFDCLMSAFGDVESVANEELVPVNPRVGHLLVVEDNVVNQRVVVALLRQIGYTADVASDGLAAVAMVRDHSFDAVLMDCQMPGMDGYEATRAIRRLGGSAATTPIIAITASSLEDEDRDFCLATGMNDFLGKPIDRDRMIEVLQRCTADHSAVLR